MMMWSLLFLEEANIIQLSQTKDIFKPEKIIQECIKPKENDF